MAIFTARAAEVGGDDMAAQQKNVPKPPVVAVSEAVAVTAQKQYYVAALVLTAAGVVGGCILMAMRHPDNSLPQLAPGVGVFAVLYIFAPGHRAAAGTGLATPRRDSWVGRKGQAVQARRDAPPERDADEGDGKSRAGDRKGDWP